MITKRNGALVSFDKEKIINAVNKTFIAIDGKPNDLSKEIAESFNPDWDYTVEQIQDMVEAYLMDSDRKDVARAYVRHRYKREAAREHKDIFFKAIGEKLRGIGIENSNANMDENSFSGRIGTASDLMNKMYALEYCLSPMAKANHLGNRIYEHDLSAYASGMHNCAARETKFCTADGGVHSFKDYNDGDRVKVITHTGACKEAVVRKYGVQKLNKITFKLASRTVTERFTANHRWILSSGAITDNLKIGDKLFKAPLQIRTDYDEFDFDNATEREQYYWCLGFVLGDGTEACRWSHGKKNEDVKFVRLRLCGDKNKYEQRFANIKHSARTMSNGDRYLTFSSIIGFRKILPDVTSLTRGEKQALFNGLYCADGQKAGHKSVIMTTDKKLAEFIENEAPSLGWFILNAKNKEGQKTNYQVRKFSMEYTFIGKANKYYWTVDNIEEDGEEEVWCLEVEDDHSFVLPNGIVTGNCLSAPIDKLLANGFKIRQTDIRPAGSVNTAMQLIAVIFQLQSLCQFGGISSTHVDYSLAPYVRKSFIKHYETGLKYVEAKDIDFKPSEDMSILDERYKKYHKAYDYAMDMTKREIHQGAEALYHNLNSLQSRSGGQLPFSSLNYGTCTLEEGRMVTRALLEVSIEGLGKFHKTSIFPCGIFKLAKGINRKPGDPNYDLFQLALKSTAQRLYPNYANVDWSGNVGYDPSKPETEFSTMGLVVLSSCKTS